ncbi:subunit ribosomal L36 [Octopus vulgaris]|uniref:Large ribosomal subunit protein bL36m n=1 Tax=Octopus vulgaris TaxID=6645 RepID=A0AA36AWJ4_OCTVU|nr:subunit ribosomal L36 [Octopus vulgaris]
MNCVLRASLNLHRNFSSIFNGIIQKTIISGNSNQTILRALSTTSTCSQSFSTKNFNVPSGPLISKSPSCLLSNNSSLFSILPTSGFPWQQKRTYKMKLYPKLRCKGCYFVYRHRRLYVECNLKPRHKQMEFKTKGELWREDYSKGGVKTAAFWKWSKEAWYKRGDNKYSRFDWLQGKYD